MKRFKHHNELLASQRKQACRSHCGCAANPTNTGSTRREFLKVAGLGAGALTFQPWRAMAGPFERTDFEKLVPADKKLQADWVKSLTARGERTVYRGADLEKIGMPVGGICAGQMYLGGDGRLWHWDIFNQRIGTGSEHYAKPLALSAPLALSQGNRITWFITLLHTTSGRSTAATPSPSTSSVSPSTRIYTRFGRRSSGRV